VESKNYIDWNVKETFWLGLTVFIIAFLLNGMTTKFVSLFLVSEDNIRWTVSSLHKFIIIFFLVLLARCKIDRDFLVYFKLTKQPNFAQIKTYLAAFLVVFIFNLLIFNLYTGGYNNYREEEVAHLNLYLIFIAVVLIGPIAEELFFRGFLYQGWCEHSDRKYVGYFSISFLFALVHLGSYDPIRLLWVFMFSLVLCHARDKTQSLVLPIYLHILNNLIAFILNYRVI
jgi:membrane protease YdiL (CAAX protease family)